MLFQDWIGQGGSPRISRKGLTINFSPEREAKFLMMRYLLSFLRKASIETNKQTSNKHLHKGSSFDYIPLWSLFRHAEAKNKQRSTKYVTEHRLATNGWIFCPNFWHSFANVNALFDQFVFEDLFCNRRICGWPPRNSYNWIL